MSQESVPIMIRIDDLFRYVLLQVARRDRHCINLREVKGLPRVTAFVTTRTSRWELLVDSYRLTVNIFFFLELQHCQSTFCLLYTLNLGFKGQPLSFAISCYLLRSPTWDRSNSNLETRVIISIFTGRLLTSWDCNIGANSLDMLLECGC